MKSLNLGIDGHGKKIELDLVKEKIDFILLVGGTGSGKSIFHNYLYKQLSESYSPDELGFVFLDNTMTDFNDWQSDYVVKSVMGRPQEAIKALAEIANQEPRKILFIHIEECDIVHIDRAEVEASLMKLKRMENVFIVYSTSRIDRDYLGDWMKKFTCLKVVFRVPTEDDSTFLLGNNSAAQFDKAGERVLAFSGVQIPCQPFSKGEAEVLESFKL
jgi:hypothetical protein